MSAISDNLEFILKGLKPDDSVGIIVAARLTTKIISRLPAEMLENLKARTPKDQLVYDPPDGRDPFEHMKDYFDALGVNYDASPITGLINTRLKVKHIRDLAEQPYVGLIDKH